MSYSCGIALINGSGVQLIPVSLYVLAVALDLWFLGNIDNVIFNLNHDLIYFTARCCRYYMGVLHALLIE